MLLMLITISALMLAPSASQELVDKILKVSNLERNSLKAEKKKESYNPVLILAALNEEIEAWFTLLANIKDGINDEELRKNIASIHVCDSAFKWYVLNNQKEALNSLRELYQEIVTEGKIHDVAKMIDEKIALYEQKAQKGELHLEDFQDKKLKFNKLKDVCQSGEGLNIKINEIDKQIEEICSQMNEIERTSNTYEWPEIDQLQIRSNKAIDQFKSGNLPKEDVLNELKEVISKCSRISDESNIERLKQARAQTKLLEKRGDGLAAEQEERSVQQIHQNMALLEYIALNINKTSLERKRYILQNPASSIDEQKAVIQSIITTYSSIVNMSSAGFCFNILIEQWSVSVARLKQISLMRPAMQLTSSEIINIEELINFIKAQLENCIYHMTADSFLALSNTLRYMQTITPEIKTEIIMIISAANELKDLIQQASKDQRTVSISNILDRIQNWLRDHTEKITNKTEKGWNIV